MAGPILKWAGGKENLREQYEAILVKASEFLGVRDVCVGGGALFFGLCPSVRPAVLTDINQELIDMYLAVRENGQAVMAALDVHQAAFDKAAAANDYPAYQAVFNALRALDLKSLPLVERAARMIALNKTAHNGLYRKNKGLGEFNAPCGRHDRPDGTFRTPRLYNGENMRRVATALAGVRLEVCDIVKAIDAALPGEAVFCDPPYDPIVKGGFVSYDGAGFSEEDQARTAQALHRAAKRGCYVVAMNHDTPFVRELYRGFSMHIVYALRSMSAKGDGRGLKPELLMVLDGRRAA